MFGRVTWIPACAGMTSHHELFSAFCSLLSAFCSLYSYLSACVGWIREARRAGM